MWLWDASWEIVWGRFSDPGSPLVFKIMNCSLRTCSKSLMPYSIQFINNYKLILRVLPGPAFFFYFSCLLHLPFFDFAHDEKWWEMLVAVVGLIVSWSFFSRLYRNTHVINSTPITRAIPYPNVLICFTVLIEERLSATVSRISDSEITSRCLLKAFNVSCCRSWISTEILPWFNRCCLTLSQLNCVLLYLKAVTQKEV